jgi:hypothetical protein
MPQKAWATEAEKKGLFNAYEARKLWPGGYPTLDASNFHLLVERDLKDGLISIPEAQERIDNYDFKYPNSGYKAKVLDMFGHGVVIPYKEGGLRKVLFGEATTTIVIADRWWGKTAWSIDMIFRHWNALNQHAEIHWYGDIDNMALGLKQISEDYESDFPTEVKRFGNLIRTHEGSYDLPGEPPTGMWQIMFLNEVDRSTMGKRALSEVNVRLNELSFRVRHYKRPVYYNVVDYNSFESVLRRTGQVKVFKFATGELLSSLLSKAPEGWRPVIRQIVPTLTVEESLVIYPINFEITLPDGTKGRAKGGQAMEIYTTTLPSWYEKVKDRVSMNKVIAYGRRGIPPEAAMDAAKLYRETDITWKMLADEENKKWNLNYSPREWNSAVKEIDPEYVPKRKGLKASKEKEGGEIEGQGQGRT